VSQFVRGGHLLPGRGRQRAQVVGVDVDPSANSVGRDGDVPAVVGDLIAEQGAEGSASVERALSSST
jgi:hypothetical protein